MLELTAGRWPARPPRPGAVFFTVKAKSTLHIAPSGPPCAGDHLRKLNQVLPTEAAPACSDGNKWVWSRRIRPTRWERAQRALSIVEVDAILAPVMAIHDQFILLAEQRMERVRHPEGWSRCAPIRCIRRPGTKAASNGPFAMYGTPSGPDAPSQRWPHANGKHGCGVIK